MISRVGLLRSVVYNNIMSRHIHLRDDAQLSDSSNNVSYVSETNRNTIFENASDLSDPDYHLQSSTLANNLAINKGKNVGTDVTRDFDAQALNGTIDVGADGRVVGLF